MPQNCRRKILFDSWPGAFRPFGTVVRVFAGDRLGPAVPTVAVYGHQEDAAAVGAAEAGLKKMDERHANFAQRDGFDFQPCG